LTLETPRSGDEVFWTTPFSIRWRDAHAFAVDVEVRDIGGGSLIATPELVDLLDDDLNRKALTLTFADFFKTSRIRPPAGTYDVTIRLRASAGGYLASTTIRVKF
jgi:hypothetical protein